jgi:hypothetical protein
MKQARNPGAKQRRYSQFEALDGRAIMKARQVSLFEEAPMKQALEPKQPVLRINRSSLRAERPAVRFEDAKAA